MILVAPHGCHLLSQFSHIIGITIHGYEHGQRRASPVRRQPEEPKNLNPGSVRMKTWVFEPIVRLRCLLLLRRDELLTTGFVRLNVDVSHLRNRYHRQRRRAPILSVNIYLPILADRDPDPRNVVSSGSFC